MWPRGQVTFEHRCNADIGGGPVDIWEESFLSRGNRGTELRSQAGVFKDKKGPSAAGVRLEQRRSRSHRVWLAIVRI